MRLDFKLKKEIKEFLKQKLKEERETVYLYTPYKFSKEEIEAVKNKFPEIKERRIVNLVDDSLIAGFKIKIGTKVYDYSLKNILTSFKKAYYEELG